jgi:hypothetical protein
VFCIAWKPKIMGELFVNWESLSHMCVCAFNF